MQGSNSPLEPTSNYENWNVTLRGDMRMNRAIGKNGHQERVLTTASASLIEDDRAACLTIATTPPRPRSQMLSDQDDGTTRGGGLSYISFYLRSHRPPPSNANVYTAHELDLWAEFEESEMRRTRATWPPSHSTRRVRQMSEERDGHAAPLLNAHRHHQHTSKSMS
ncbi:hypothetical protein Hypma_016159 [Hypsizygus marmoreus]|uniref:Uncharacterized protein n=1 Tax=Hypsizygus marmoreus TaxID=39966 RepID=A0A369J5G8_HYPMA|nr:hypothetical protein Hypma_016159 [Hypsizygus marmoreus]